MSLSKFNLVKLQNHRGKFLFQNVTVNLLTFWRRDYFFNFNTPCT